jgi:hypothetical protein
VTEPLAGISSTSFKILCHSKASKENLYLISECQCSRFCNRSLNLVFAFVFLVLEMLSCYDWLGFFSALWF